MGQNATKAQGNIYFQCRKEAAKYNDRLCSREGASELLGCSVSTLADYELGITKFIPVDSVVRMADLYNAPHLKNYFCTHECPIGKSSVPELEVAELDRLTIKVLAACQRVSSVRDTLIDITADGKITADEKESFKEVLDTLDRISKTVQELKLWAERENICEE